MSETTNLKLFKQDNPTTNTNNFDIEKTLNENWDKLDENAGTTNKKLESLEKVDSPNRKRLRILHLLFQKLQNRQIRPHRQHLDRHRSQCRNNMVSVRRIRYLGPG